VHANAPDFNSVPSEQKRQAFTDPALDPGAEYLPVAHALQVFGEFASGSWLTAQYWQKLALALLYVNRGHTVQESDPSAE